MKKTNFTFIDLFAGIGGFHLAMHNLWWKCVFASEIDTFARKTYQENFANISPELFENNQFNDDIRKINPADIPDFDLLCAWFPCQPFSQAGLKKWFSDNHKSERWNLFFYIAEILETKKPKAFFLENVRWLLSHENGKTFKIIQNILENELWYSLYYQVVKASDYGLPQHRPRIFLIGFRDDNQEKKFQFPETEALQFTMSDVFDGECEKEIGFTLRVWWRGSNIDDRRNWEFYRVDGEIKRIGIEEWKKMQWFPESFIFPVSEAQSMKQLGNSVAVLAVEKVAKNMIQYLQQLQPKNIIMKGKNKWEWSELFVFLKILQEKEIFFWNENLQKKDSFLKILKISNQNIENNYILKDNCIIIQNKKTQKLKEIAINTLLTKEFLKHFEKNILNGKNTFFIPEYEIIQNVLWLEIVKWWTSNQKSDIELDFEETRIYEKQWFGIKSYLWATPTLLNASWNTNFIFEVKDLPEEKLEEINSINSSQKLKERLQKILQYWWKLKYKWAEKEIMEFNLKMIDTSLPNLIGQMLIEFYLNRNVDIQNIIAKITKKLNTDEQKIIENISKKFLVAILLWFFAGKKWNGIFEAQWAIILQKTWELLAYHIIKMEDLQNYLYNHIKFDTPSTSRHMFWKLYKEKDGKIYFKLNLQLRFK